MFQELDKNIAKRIAFNQEEIDFLHSVLVPKKIKKKEFLLQAGEVCLFEAYLVKGIARIYYLNEKGFEVDLLFPAEDWWVSDIGSFTEQKPSQLFIQAIEDCEFLFLGFNSKAQLLTKFPVFERYFRVLVQKSLESVMNRLIGNISKPAEERYLEFISKYPSIPQRVPQHLIAAYLGISPEFLSKVRAKLRSNK